MAGLKPLLETVGALLPRIKAWHASPHDFDKFDLSKIGTGQGAASYGPGIYAAESKAVSGQGGEYWQEFARHPAFDKTQRDAADFLSLHNFDRQKAAQQTRAQLERNSEYNKGRPISEEELASLAAERAEFEKVVKLLEGEGQVGPRVYELNIKADPRSFLQWDEPLSQQPNVVEAYPKLLDRAKTEAYGRMLASTNQHRANQLSGMMKDPLSATGEFAFHSGAGGETLMKEMRDAGIPGIRYADAASRTPVAAKSFYDALATAKSRLVQAEQKGAPQWELDHLRQSVDQADARVRKEKADFPRTYNYVINNPEIIDILRKLAIPGMVGGAATAYQPQGQQ